MKVLLTAVACVFAITATTVLADEPIQLTLEKVSNENGGYSLQFLSSDGIVTEVLDYEGAAVLALINQALIQETALELRSDPKKVRELLTRRVVGWSGKIRSGVQSLFMKIAVDAQMGPQESFSDGPLSGTRLNARDAKRAQDANSRVTSAVLMSRQVISYGELTQLIGHYFYSHGAEHRFATRVRLQNGDVVMSGGEPETLAFMNPLLSSYTQAGALLNNFNNVICERCLAPQGPRFVLADPVDVLTLIENNLEIQPF